MARARGGYASGTLWVHIRLRRPQSTGGALTTYLPTYIPTPAYLPPNNTTLTLISPYLATLFPLTDTHHLSGHCPLETRLQVLFAHTLVLHQV